MTLFGIRSCDTCRRATKHLEACGAEFQFHDLRTDGLDDATLERWAADIDWQLLLNKRSLTWRKIPEADKSQLNRDRALELMLNNPTLIKRPLLDAGQELLVGFSAPAYDRVVSGR